MKNISNIEYLLEKDFHYKGYSIWKKQGGAVSPVLILKKPKHLSEEKYENLIKNMSFNIKNKDKNE